MTGRYKAYPEYKDSGSEWVGKIPAQWKTTKLKYIFDIQKRIAGEVGYDVLSITQRGIKVKDIESGDGQLSMDYSKYQLVYKGDFAMNHMDLLTGYVDISSFDGVTSPDYRVFRLVNSVRFYDRYHLYLLQFCYKKKVFFPLGQGSAHLGRWRLPTEAFNEVEYPTPSFSEQQQIANFLDHETTKIDTLITKQEKLIELLKEKRQAVISHAVTKGLNPDAPMKDSGVEWLGEVPEHWSIRRVKNSALLVSEKETIDGQSVIALENIESLTGKFVKSESTYSGEDVAFIKDDILFSKLRPYLAKVYRCQGKGIAFGDLLTYRPFSDTNSSFLFYSMISAWFIEIVDSSTYGAKMPRASSDFVSEMYIAFPPQKEQEEIAKYLDKTLLIFDELSQKSKNTINLMQERKTALISAAVTGKIDVRDWQGEA